MKVKKQFIKTKLIKSVTALLLITLSNQILMPTMAWALTSGPTAPEATSFEPIDTTDMVNPLTGDFTYNLPLLEVPGPEGGYPLSLSYHAGIQPNEEASWVGLGWTLNPGAISRNVNGYPDDWHDINNISRSYWSGGHTKTVGVDVGVGLGPASVNFGLSFAQDTYKGFGTGFSVGVGANIPGSPVNIGISAGVTPFGEAYAGANVGLSGGLTENNAWSASGGLGISNSSAGTSMGFSGGVSYNDRQTEGNKVSNTHVSMIGASIGSSGGSISLLGSGGGSSSVNNANEGRISTESSSSWFGIPTPVVSLGVSYNYVRYWSDETANILSNGVIYGHHALLNASSTMNDHADDTYNLLDPAHNNIGENPEPSKQAGGTYPNFDNYNVTAQGLSGNMRPYIYSTVLYNQNVINNNDHKDNVISVTRNGNGYNENDIWGFRFINDFSNSFKQNPSWYSDEQYSFDNNPQYGSLGMDGINSYNRYSGNLEGTKHIAYFTNDQISQGYAGTNGFMDCKAAGFSRVNGWQIGGFMITNASGVTYHYALPAYSSNEHIHTENVDKAQFGNRFNDLNKNSASYAYTWYLTAITGPDFVDRGIIGEFDDQDWGYWVKFEYGKWTDSYVWRNPSEGFNYDIDNQFKSFSEGTKEVYYLDAIRTRTHTAIFEKEIRADGKGNNRLQDTNYELNEYDFCTDGNGDHGTTYFSYPKATLRLNNIYLFNNDELPTSINSIRSRSSNYNLSFTISNNRGCPSFENKVHTGQFVIDKFDIDPSWASMCLRKIAFNYDYSLSEGVPNSYDPGGVNTYIPSPPDRSGALLGKLTLLSVDFKGKGGASTLPPVEFGYDLDPTELKNQSTVSLTSISSSRKGTIQVQSNTLKVGDIITFNLNSVKYYCTLLNTSDNMNFQVLYLNNTPPNIASGISATKTKNPPYNKDAFDLWGCYKSDFEQSANENLSRGTSKISNASADVWSLRKIRSSLGASVTVSYEGDSYNKAVLTKNMSFTTGGISNDGGRQFHFSVNNGSFNLNELYHVGDKIDIIILKKDIYPQVNYSALSSRNYVDPVIVTSISGNNLTIKTGAAMDADLSANSGGFLLTSNLITHVNNQFYGGGIRVKDIQIDNNDGVISKSSYNYDFRRNNTLGEGSSGVTSYEPVIFDKDETSQYGADAQKKFRKELYKDINYLLAVSREVPAPGVMYENVIVQDSNILPTGEEVPVAGNTIYQYETFKSEMLGIKEHNYNSADVDYNTHIISGYYVDHIIRRNLSIKDYTARVGTLKKVTTYDIHGNKLFEKINHYLHDDLDDTPIDNQISQYEPRLSAYNNIGVIQERYGNSRIALNHLKTNQYDADVYNDILIMSAKETFPAIQTGTTQIDYKNGTKIEQKILAYDFYNGAVSKTLTIDSYGNRFVNEVKPAYRIYPAMGINTYNTGSNKHMLTQQAYDYTFKVDENNNPVSVVNATAQTWGTGVPVIDPENTILAEGEDVWRMKSSFSWMAPGFAVNNLTSYNSFTDYFATNGSANSSWKKTSEITLYNVFSNALEATDINQNYATTHMGYRTSRVILTGGHSKYNEIAFAGGEDGLLNNGKSSANVSPGTGILNAAAVHSGKYSLSVGPGSTGFNYTMSLSSAISGVKDYVAMVWVKPSANNISGAGIYYQISGQAQKMPVQTYQKSAAGWYLLEIRIPKNEITVANGSGDLVIGCKNSGTSGDLYFDDFRFQPLTASAIAYVYDIHTGELSHILGNNNLYVKYEYDAAGRLVKVYREVLGKPNIPLVGTTTYNYSRSVN